MTDLSREIAARSAAWQQPGAACRDPETGVVWRLDDNNSWHPSERVAHRADCTSIITRAIAAGPLLTDAATAGVLLGLMPDMCVLRHVLGSGDHVQTLWTCTTDVGWYARDLRPTRAEATARAYLASLGGCNG